MQCNITRTGRLVRLAWGLLCLIAAAALALAEVLGWLTGWWGWVLVLPLAGLGVFGIYEARKGWCAVRAMGVKTPV
jgi:hypothetical protein